MPKIPSTSHLLCNKSAGIVTIETLPLQQSAQCVRTLCTGWLRAPRISAGLVILRADRAFEWSTMIVTGKVDSYKYLRRHVCGAPSRCSLRAACVCGVAIYVPATATQNHAEPGCGWDGCAKTNIQTYFAPTSIRAWRYMGSPLALLVLESLGPLTCSESPAFVYCLL